MKCPRCGAPSDVVETRAWRELFNRRRRRCFNGHTFESYEVTAGVLDRRAVTTVLRGLQARRRADQRRRLVLANPDMPASAAARQLGITEARVRQIRAEA
jgi:hypothetical protein